MTQLFKTINGFRATPNAFSQAKSNKSNVITHTFFSPSDHEDDEGLTSHQDFLRQIMTDDLRDQLAGARKALAEGANKENSALRQLRLKAGLSQHEFAERIGTQQYRISRYEAGKERPSAAVIEQMKGILGADIVTLWKACGYQ